MQCASYPDRAAANLLPSGQYFVALKRLWLAASKLVPPMNDHEGGLFVQASAV